MLHRAPSVKIFLLDQFSGKLNYMAVLSFFIPKSNSIQTPVLPVLQCSSALLLRCLTQQTDGQYSYYTKNVKGCLPNKIICIEHYTLVGQQVSPVFQIIHLKQTFTLQLASYTEFRQLHNFKTLQSHEVVFSMSLHLHLAYSCIDKTQA